MPITMNAASARILIVDRMNSYSPMKRTPTRLIAISMAMMIAATIQIGAKL